MSFTVLTTSPAHRMFKKFPPPIRAYLTKQAEQLSDNPELGEQLTGALRTYRSLHTKFKNVSYRMVYEINQREQQVIIRAVGSRENFYKHLQQLKLHNAA